MGEEKHDGLSIPGRVVLAHEPPFTIGELHVDPPTRQVEGSARRETLEPRVMQVLVALARANGRIVARDELTAWCWDGRIVGEDAINRAIFRLRQVASEIGGGSFGIETITKVGYRLTGQGAVSSAAPPAILSKPAMDRRTWIAAAAVIALPTVILAFFYGQSRIFFTIARDGLLPTNLARVSARGTPVRITIFTAIVTSIFAGLIPLTSIAALATQWWA